MSKAIKCPRCDGYRFIEHLEIDCGIGYDCWSEICKECNGKGYLEIQLFKEDDNNG